MIRRTLSLLALLMILAACGPSPTVEGTPTPQATITTLPTSTALASATPAESAERSGAFTLVPDDVAYDARWLTDTVQGEVMAADEEAGMPPHLRFSLGVPLADEVDPREGQLLIYPVAEYEVGDEQVAQRVARLRELVAQRPLTVEGTLPLLPLLDAQETAHAQVAFLDFEGGSGVRYLAQVDQALVPITNEGLFYTFQGLSTDERYLIMIFYPVSSPTLDSTVAEERFSSDPDGFVMEFDTYQSSVVEQLDALPVTEFEPTLDRLDLLVESLIIGTRGGGTGSAGGGASAAEMTSTPLPTVADAGPTAVPNPTIESEGPTELVLLRPAVPGFAEAGGCDGLSQTLPRPGAYRCTVGDQFLDPCVMSTDGQTVVCDMQPLNNNPGFALQLTRPLPSEEPSSSDKPYAWLIEFDDGTYCSFVSSITGEVEGQRINYLCSDQSMVVGDLEIEQGSWYASRANVLNQGGTFKATDEQRLAVERVWR